MIIVNNAGYNSAAEVSHVVVLRRLDLSSLTLNPNPLTLFACMHIEAFLHTWCVYIAGRAGVLVVSVHGGCCTMGGRPEGL